MSHRLRNVLDRALGLMEFAWRAVVIGAFIALPVWVLYRIVAPIFGTDPIGYLRDVALGLGGIVLFSLGATAIAILIGRVFDKFVIVRAVAKGIAAMFIAIAVVGALSRCSGSESSTCITSRYFDC